MFVAHISHLVPMDYRAAFPNVSFPASGPSDDFLTEQGFAKVSAFKDHDRATQKLVNVAAYYEAPWVYTVKVVDKTAEDIQAETDAQAANVRAQRDRLLAESDWVTIKAVDASADGLGVQLPMVWINYRKALRDITVQEGFPWTIVWPEKP
jgi:hypothetical protein